jgi:hypothetical protein
VPLSRIKLAVVVAGLLAIAAASASAQLSGATATFVQSAKHGGLQGDQLTLRGVGRSVHWRSSSRGKPSGGVSFQLLERRLFSHSAAVTADLHVAGQLGVARLQISHPSYNARRGTVSYRVKRLNQRRVPRRFGAASLSIVVPPRVGGTGDYSCQTQVEDNTAYGLQPIDSTKSELDKWALESPPDAAIGHGDVTSWESDGSLFKGCSNSVVWKFVSDPNSSNPPTPPSGTVTFSVDYPNDGSPTYVCKPSYSGVQCKQQYATRNGVVYWELVSQ